MTDNNNQTRAPINWTASIMFILTTLVVAIGVPWYGFAHGYNSAAVISMIVLVYFTGTAITAGYHRLWSHNSYEAHPLLRLWFALWGAAALQNTILDWCSGHRVHHRHCDDLEKDPYSAKRGFWFSHMGWMIRDYPSSRVDFSNVKNLRKDPIVMWQYKYYGQIALGMNFGVPIALGLVLGDVWGMLLLAGFMRLFITHHVTFFINSLAHMWGTQPYTDENTARDNHFLAFFTHGEGYHNFHHIFQNDYRNGIKWYHWDPTKWIIKGASLVGLASNLRTVPDFKIRRAMVKMQFKRAQAKLAKAEGTEKWSELLEKEYDRFHQMLNEWTDQHVEKLGETRKQLQEKWEKAAVRQRYRELEEQLHQQSDRLKEIMADYRASLAS